MKKFFIAMLFVIVSFNTNAQGWYRTKHKADAMLGTENRYEYRSPKWMVSYEQPSVHIFSNRSTIYLAAGRYEIFDVDYDVHTNKNLVNVIVGFFDNAGNLIDKMCTTFECDKYDWAASSPALGRTILKWIMTEGFVKIYAPAYDGHRLTYVLDHNPNMINNKIK